MLVQLATTKLLGGEAHQEGDGREDVSEALYLDLQRVAGAVEERVEAEGREAPPVGVGRVGSIRDVQGTVTSTVPPGASVCQRFVSAVSGWGMYWSVA